MSCIIVSASKWANDQALDYEGLNQSAMELQKGKSKNLNIIYIYILCGLVLLITVKVIKIFWRKVKVVVMSFSWSQ